jgi:hypothetical protein
VVDKKSFKKGDWADTILSSPVKMWLEYGARFWAFDLEDYGDDDQLNPTE